MKILHKEVLLPDSWGKKKILSHLSITSQENGKVLHVAVHHFPPGGRGGNIIIFS